MSFFRRRNKTVEISQADPMYKVKYLGNVLTAFLKGDGCIDRPVSILWNNHKAQGPTAGLHMELTVCSTGLKVETKEQGLTEYRAHRISYCICHPEYPRLFIWVYRHEGKKMKVEIRCHAVLCSSDAKAKAIAVHLHDKLAFALAEFTREKMRRQHGRLLLTRANSVPSSSTPSGVPVRIKYLSGGQNFKPPSEQSSGAPKLGAIAEDRDAESNAQTSTGNRWSRVAAKNGYPIDRVVEEDEEVEESINGSIKGGKAGGGGGGKGGVTESLFVNATVTINTRGDNPDDWRQSTLSDSSSLNGDALSTGVLFELEIGNDIDELKGDMNVQREIRRAAEPDTDSIESGFSEQDGHE